MTDDLWVYVHDEHFPDVHMGLRDPHHWWAADVNWDGCVHLHERTRIGDGEDELPVSQWYTSDIKPQYWHQCGDIDTLIARLQELKAKAQAYFGDWWPDYTKRPDMKPGGVYVRPWQRPKEEAGA